MTSSQWQPQPDGTVLIPQPIRMAARLFGLPFLAIGGWFSYQLIMATHESVSAGGLGELAGNILGLLILLFMALLFGAPGVLLVVARKFLLLRPAPRQVVELFDFFVYRKENRRDIPTEAFVTLRFEAVSPTSTSATRGHSHFACMVYVKVSARDRILAAMTESADRARELGRETATLLGLQLEDTIDADRSRCGAGGAGEDEEPEEAAVDQT